MNQVKIYIVCVVMVVLGLKSVFSSELGKVCAHTTIELLADTVGAATDQSCRDGKSKTQILNNVFILLNFPYFLKEFSVGKGERLSALAHLYGCPNNLENRLGKQFKKEYSYIFHNPNELTLRKFKKNIKEVIEKDEILVKNCKNH